MGDKKRRIGLNELEHPDLTSEYYKKNLKKEQLRLLNLQIRLVESKRNVVIALEGPDAAGKGGAIKRILERLDPRLVRTYSVGKPTYEEHRRHYLWRFWTKQPPYGEMSVFDRTWYGRVLVERVEGFATKKEWQRAYDEINQFEKQIIDDGTILIKMYLHISKDEQLKRFEHRMADPYKHWKINDEDWRNREKWDQHIAAAEDMFALTHTAIAPWHVIAGNYKWHARLSAVRIVADCIEAGLQPLSDKP